jgi:predicted nucleotidyltransferase
MHIIYEAVIGSKLKGNDNENSDTDTMGIFIAKNEDIGGFDWNDSKNTLTTASPDGDDETFYELRKFFRLAAKSTPAILPFLASDKLISSSPLGEEALRIAREDLIATKWLRKQADYILGKWEVYCRRGNPKDLLETWYIGELVCRYLYEETVVATLDHEILYSVMTHERFLSEGAEKQLEALDIFDYSISNGRPLPMIKAEPDWTEATKFLKHVRNNIG